MKKILILAKREYKAAVKTKGFIISIVLVPIMMGGSLLAFALLQDKVDTKDKNIVIIDESGVVGKSIQEFANYRNENQIFDEETGEKNKPAYFVEIIEPDKYKLDQQKLELSERVRSREIHSFIHIGRDVVYPGENQEGSRIYYFSENSSLDNVRGWIAGPIGNRLRELRAEGLNLGQEDLKNLFYYIPVEAMGLITMDTKTGNVKEARSTNELEAIVLPYIMMMLMFMMLIMAAIPLLSAVMEEKNDRIAEVLLGSVTPFQFMMGKIVGGIGISLTTSSIYIIGGVITAAKLDYLDRIPLEILPWFFSFMILAIIMVGSVMAALGSACNDAKDAQAMQFPAMIPLIIPMFIMFVMIQNPMSNFAIWASLFPPFTPMLMVIRMATSVTIPLWQPIVGMIGVCIFALFSVWAGGRIFRSAILLQGTKPKLGTLIKYIVKG